MPTTPTATHPAFRLQPGLHVTVQTPQSHLEVILEAIGKITPLEWGFYDRVSFTTTPGIQRFRSLGGGQNTATENVVEVACVELSFALAADEKLLEQVLAAIFHAHPYEEPVIRVQSARFSRHLPGTGGDSPHKFWNQSDLDWVPPAHR